MRVLVAAFLAFSVVVVSSVFHVASADDVTVPSSSATAPSESELALFNLTNQDRIKAGLQPLTFDTELLEIARVRVEAQQSESLTHLDAAGQLAFVGLITGANISYTRAGENLARVPSPVG